MVVVVMGSLFLFLNSINKQSQKAWKIRGARSAARSAPRSFLVIKVKPESLSHVITCLFLLDDVS